MKKFYFSKTEIPFAMLNFTRYRQLIALFLLLIPFVSGAQSHTHSWECGSDLVLESARQNPDWLKKYQQSEQRIYDFFASKTEPIAGKRMMVVTLPVVVHIIHNNGLENISDAQVLNGIQLLNEAFANTAYYDQGTGTNTMIQFCLAQRTPDDQGTTGITRNQDPLTEVTIETEDLNLKNLNRWTPTDYINIWLVREICSSGSGCGVAGYAYLPGSHGNPEDGIVMEADLMGSTPGGTGVLVHEMGHYLGLYHTFQGGCNNNDCLADGDRVCDTPPDQSTLWVSCNSTVNTCTTDAQSGFSSDQPDMILNFMDYTDFACFNDFTPGQSDRMHWHIENVRSSLLDSKGCLSPCPNPVTAAFTASATSVNVGQIVNFTNGSTNASAYTWTINGVPFSNAVNPTYAFTTAGTFSIVMTASSNNPALCNPASFTRIIEVICPVVADFDVSNLTPAIGEAVAVTNQSQNATQYEWFLEGVSQGATFSGFTPNATGVYVVKLVAGNGFCQKTKIIYLSVQDSCANVSFQRTWGGPGDDRGSRTTTLADGNFLVAGTTVVSGETDIYLLKTGTDGTTLWQSRFGLAGAEQVGNLLALPDGGWILLGNTTFVAGNTHPFLARFSADGTVLWQRKINTPAAVNIFTCAIRTQDGNLLVGGAINASNAFSYAAYLAKITLDGTVLWSNVYDGGNTDWIAGVLELPNGDLVATGFTLSFGQNTSSIHDGMVMRLTSTGTLQWVNAYGSFDNEGFSSIFLTPDGNLMTMGSTSGWNGPGGGQFMDDSWMVKLSQNGALLWSEVLRTNFNLDLASRGVYQSSDGGFVIAANDLGATGTNFNSIFFKTDPDGDLEWSRMYAPTAENKLTSVNVAPDGYLFTGYTDISGNDEIWFLKTDEAGLAGVCPEIPHQVNTLPVQPVVTPGQLSTLTAPAMVVSALAVNGIVHAEDALCSPVCIEDSCEDTWIKNLGIHGVVEGASNLIRANDGNFYLSGYRGDSTLLAKMTPEGLVLWTRTFKFTSGTLENVSQIIEDSDGNLVGCGLFRSNQFRGFTFKYAPSSDQVVWAFENPATPQSLYFAILEMAPGGNYLAFNSYHSSPAPGSQDDANMVEINRNTGQYTGIDQAFSFGSSEGVIEAQQHNGFVYTSGRYTYGNNLSGMRGGISCFDLAGNEIWSRMPFFGPSVPARNYGTDFVFDGDNMVTIYYGDFMGSDASTEQFAVSKTDLNGNMSWARLYTLDGFPEVYVKSIITVPDGYVIFSTNQKIDQPASIFLIKIDKNGAVLWAQDYRDMFVEHGEKFLATANGYLYFTASYGTGDITLAKVQLSNGLVGNGCGWPLELVVSAEDLPLVFDPINLVNYPAPITQSTRVAIPFDRSLPLTNLCLISCFPEICNNGLDDDADGLFDCLDPQCDCSGCDGEQTRYWYFGDGGGLDFATDPPTVLSNGQTFGNEASSVATDMMGNLLFYTDASRLYDRNHNLMPNGNNLDGHSSTTQTLILPQPGSPWLFWVFTPNSFDNLATGKGLSYSIVDMSLNGSLGDVVPGQKNIELLPQSQFTEKITATRHCNGTDWWVLVKERNNNNFRAYLLTAAGLGAPVISSVGTASSVSIPNVIGTLKFNPGGYQVVNVLFHSNSFELFDFDKSTGLLSNPVSVVDPVKLEGSYAVEFSADGKLLYLSKLRPPSQIWQFNLNAGDAAAILQSGVVLAEFPDEYRFGQLQRAPNGKIYVTNTFPLQFTNSLGIIHQPEVLGTGCLYQQQGLSIAPGGANLGLPSFPQDFLPQRLFLDIQGPDSLCSLPGNLSFNLNISNRCVLDSVRWTLVGPGSIVSQSDEGIELSFDQAGMVTLVARAYSACFDGVDTLQIHVFENNTPVLDLGPDVQTCDNGVEVLDAGPGFREYRWNDGSTESTLTTLFPGTYWVDVWDACGNHQSDTIHISILPATVLDLGDDRTICSNASLTYTLPPSFTSWTWSPATGLDCNDCNTVNITAGDTITYIVVASNGENCLSADTLTIFYTVDTVFANLDTVVCSDETLLLFGLELPADTVVHFYGISAGGCDSVLTVTVTGLDPVQTLVQESICPGDTLNFNGISITRDTAFQLLLTGVNGCDSLVLVEVSVTEPPARTVTLQACPGTVAIYGGVPIPAGTTQVVYVPGVAGTCDSVITVTVVLSPPPVLQLPATDTLAAGNTIQLTPSVFGTGPFLWQWSPAAPPELLSCYTCPDPVASPLTPTLFTVTVTDANGCEGVDSIALFVKPCGDPYVPNVFSPNGDGINDWFYLQSSECEVHIRYLRVFDRWGELVFQRNNFAPNIGTLGWDGRFRGREMGSNVFVWMAEIEFPDGTILLKKGDVTLLR